MTAMLRVWALALALVFALPVAAKTILFVGNSFTYGATSAVRGFHPERVTDLNREGIGGVPALFATFARAAGLDWQVSLETSPGKDLAFHRDTKRAVLGGRWDVVVLQGHSTLDPARPGDPARHARAAGDLAAMFKAGNPAARVEVMTTWPRADLVYRPGSRWSGRSLAAMTADLAAGSAAAVRASCDLAGAIPVGEGWTRAFAAGVADPNPYDGIAFDTVDLWSWDHYHASAAGYYLTALVVFARITGVDPRTLGAAEPAAGELGLSPATAAALQTVARDTVAAAR